MIDPLLPNATIKTRLLENILEIINSKDEKFLDISVVCEDGSFLWSQFLLAAASDLFATAMHGIEVTQVIFPDIQVKDVRRSLFALLYTTAPKETEHGNLFVDFFKKMNSPNCNDFVKTEVSEVNNDSDLDLNWGKPINSPDNHRVKLFEDSQLTQYKNSETLEFEANVKIEKEDSARQIQEDTELEEENINISSINKLTNLTEKLPIDKENGVNETKPKIKMKKVSVKSKCDPISTCSLCSKTFTSLKGMKNHLMGYLEKGKRKSGVHGVQEGIYLWNEIKMANKRIDNSAVHVKYKIKHVSSFSIKDIELFLKKPLQNEELDVYLRLIRDGKDMEIFSNIFKTDFTKNSERIWKCDQCQKGNFVGNLENYMGHFEMHEVKKVSFDCELCKLKTSTYKMYSSHLRDFHFNDYKCEICGDILRNQIVYKSHMNMVHNVEEHKCQICNTKFSSKSSLESHVNRVHNDPKFMCSVCGKSCKQSSQLKIHMEDVHSTEKYPCDQCDVIFKALRYLEVHKKEVHAKTCKTHICHICGKGPFTRKIILKDHIRRIHNEEKNISCNQCEKKFFSNMDLKSHMTSHSLTTYHDCQKCQKSFKRKDLLKRHIASIHTGVRHRCDQCNYQASQKGNLKGHIMRMHNTKNIVDVYDQS